MRAQLFSLFQHNDVISLSNVLVCVLTFVLWVNPGLMGVVCVLDSSGDVEVQAEVVDSGRALNGSMLGVLASSQRPRVPGTSDSWQAAVLIYNSNDSSSSASTQRATLTLKGLAAQKGSFEEFIYFI